MKDGGGDAITLFSPDANSETQGYMLIKQTDVGKNLYALGQGSALASPYDSVSVSDGVITALGTLWRHPRPYTAGDHRTRLGEFIVSANNQVGKRTDAVLHRIHRR